MAFYRAQNLEVRDLLNADALLSQSYAQHIYAVLCTYMNGSLEL